jgi:Protein of unknown function with HXXEE motif
MGLFDLHFRELTFSTAVLLFPVATTLHVLEEWPRFPHWARRFASARYSNREYVITHVLAVTTALSTAVLLWIYPLPWLVLAFFAFVFGPGVFCNALFHSAATVVSRSYCAGVLTGLFVYLPFSLLLAVLALREGLVSGLSLGAALCVALVFHTLEVGHNVFKRW